jgi:hypothetical protein
MGMGLKISTDAPCLYYSQTGLGLTIIITWINDNMIIGNQEVVKRTKKEFITDFEREDCGKMQEYVCNKINRLEDRGLKFTRDVSIQSFRDEYDVSDKKCITLITPGTVFEKVKE